MLCRVIVQLDDARFAGLEFGSMGSVGADVEEETQGCLNV